jgi:hypothetical protein
MSLQPYLYVDSRNILVMIIRLVVYARIYKVDCEEKVLFSTGNLEPSYQAGCPAAAGGSKNDGSQDHPTFSSPRLHLSPHPNVATSAYRYILALTQRSKATARCFRSLGCEISCFRRQFSEHRNHGGSIHLPDHKGLFGVLVHIATAEITAGSQSPLLTVGLQHCRSSASCRRTLIFVSCSISSFSVTLIC